MFRTVLASGLTLLLAAGASFAQETTAGAGRVEIAAFPGGGMIFMESGKHNEPDWANYALGGSFTFNVNRWFGFEGEVGGSIGVKQDLVIAQNAFTNERTPNTLSYMGNVVVNPIGNDRAFVPYGTVGFGGLTLYQGRHSEAASMGMHKNESYMTANFGGGLKWFSTRHVGLRADYRFLWVGNQDTAPVFFGREDRFGHRVYGGILLTY
jgi:hypothetical protein